MLPLDRDLNAAILSIAATLFPDGFDVTEDAVDFGRKKLDPNQRFAAR